MRRRDSEGEDQEPGLFDLPLDLPEHDRLDPGEAEEEDFEPPAAAPVPRPAPRRPAPVPAAPRSPAAAPAPRPAPEAETEPAVDTQGRAGTGSRLSAGLADLLVHAAIAALAFAGARFLGAEPTLAQWPPLALFLLSFSFLYTILPLAFWGQTLGMTWARLLSRNRDGEPLTFDQTARRWLGGLLTTATLGLPLLVAGRRRTLTDLLSGSDTYRAG